MRAVGEFQTCVLIILTRPMIFSWLDVNSQRNPRGSRLVTNIQAEKHSCTFTPHVNIEPAVR